MLSVSRNAKRMIDATNIVNGNKIRKNRAIGLFPKFLYISGSFGFLLIVIYYFISWFGMVFPVKGELTQQICTLKGRFDGAALALGGNCEAHFERLLGRGSLARRVALARLGSSSFLPCSLFTARLHFSLNTSAVPDYEHTKIFVPTTLRRGKSLARQTKPSSRSSSSMFASGRGPIWLITSRAQTLPILAQVS